VALAFYSLVQYARDPERREPVNVGLLLAHDRDLLKRFVDRDETHDVDAVARFEELLGYLHDAEFADLAPNFVLDELAHRRFGHFHITPPLQVDDGGRGSADLLDELVRRLVAPSQVAHTAQA
jgi:hypothetical protein